MPETPRPPVTPSGHPWWQPAWLLLDGAFTGWLAYAFAVFQDHEGRPAVAFALAVGGIAAVLGSLSGPLHQSRLRQSLGALLVATGVLLATRGVGALHGFGLGWRSALWLAAASALLGTGLRQALRHFPVATTRDLLGEILRWSVLLAAATWLVSPFYTHRSVGAGDAYWYTIMLADFAEQIRLGQFPVWAGATEYAFNGTISPLRLAPWFQHAGGLLDLLTGRTLDYVSLKNLLIACANIATAASAYGFLRAILPARPTVACALALACLASPAVLAPLYVGDQYMTFVAMPFLPAVAYGLWRAFHHNDRRAHLILAVGLSGLWLSHPPIALWTSLFVAPVGLVKFALHWRQPGEWTRFAWTAGLCALLGLYPLVSASSLENTAKLDIGGDVAGEEIGKAFPANFKPLGRTIGQQSDYQAGYAVLAIVALGLAGLATRRSAGALALATVTLLLLLIMVPVPVVTSWFWSHVPSLVMQATNNWPLQRLFPIWTFLGVFFFAAIHCERVVPNRPRYWFLVGTLLAPLLLWSGWEARRFLVHGLSTIPTGEIHNTLFERHNLLLTRYCFVSFEMAPSSYSHGYLSPVLEHRLLKRNLTPLLANSESAVRRGHAPAPNPDGRALLAQGVWRAVNDNQTTYYNLAPVLTLPVNQLLALRIEPLVPGVKGWLQILNNNLYREYLLPDSGEGVLRTQSSRSFGTLPTSDRVISLYTRSPDPLRVINIAPNRQARTDFDFARYELWSYDPTELPIVIKSWAPYRLTVNAPEPAYLETPRMWQGGYQAKINGRLIAAERSPDNLAMFAVPSGRSELTIRFIPSLTVLLCYWACLAGWMVLAALRFRRLFSRVALTSV